MTVINVSDGVDRSELAGAMRASWWGVRMAIDEIAAAVPFLSFDRNAQRLDVSIGSKAFLGVYGDIAMYEPAMEDEEADTHAYADTVDGGWHDWTEGTPLDAANLAEQLTSDRSIGLLLRATRRDGTGSDETAGMVEDAFLTVLGLADAVGVNVRFTA